MLDSIKTKAFNLLNEETRFKLRLGRAAIALAREGYSMSQINKVIEETYGRTVTWKKGIPIISD